MATLYFVSNPQRQSELRNLVLPSDAVVFLHQRPDTVSLNTSTICVLHDSAHSVKEERIDMSRFISLCTEYERVISCN